MEKPLSGATGTARSRSGERDGKGPDPHSPGATTWQSLFVTSQNTEVEVAGQCFVALDDIPMGHKMALRDLRAGENIRKYGSPIGHVTQDVSAGSWPYSHNLKTNLKGLLEYQYRPAPPSPDREHALPDTFRVICGPTAGRRRAMRSGYPHGLLRQPPCVGHCPGFWSGGRTVRRSLGAAA